MTSLLNQRTWPPPVVQLEEFIRTRHLVAAVVVGDLDAVAEHDLLLAAIGEVEELVFAAFDLLADGRDCSTPSGHAAEEVQAARGDTDL